MKMFEKKVKYYKFFEDIKFFEIDAEGSRLAVVFYGKENIIHIFDALPYLNYMPINFTLKEQTDENHFIDDTNIETEKLQNNNIQETRTREELHRVFDSLNTTKNAKVESVRKTIKKDNQEFIIFKESEDTDAIEEENVNKETKRQAEEIKVESNVNFEYTKEESDYDVIFSLHKAKIKTKILSCIISPSNVVIGAKWVTINSAENKESKVNKDYPSSNSENKDKTQNIKKSKTCNTSNQNLTNISNNTTNDGKRENSSFQHTKLNLKLKTLPSSQSLVSLNDDGNIFIYSLASIQEVKPTLVDLGKLQGAPFLDCKEEWKIASQIYTGKPIRDFFIPKDANKIYTLHVDNFLMVWVLAYVGVQLTILAHYAINITPELQINSFLVDRRENFIYTVHNNFLKVFKVMKSPPFPLLFSFEWEEAVNGRRKTDCGYEVQVEDLVDHSEGLREQDLHFLHNVPKPVLSLDEDSLVGVKWNQDNTHTLYKFNNKEFNDHIFTDFNFFNDSVLGLKRHLVESIQVSVGNVTYALSPFLYFKDKSDENRSFDEVDWHHFAKFVYQPLVYVSEGLMRFINLKTKEVLAEVLLKKGSKKIPGKDNDTFSLLWSFNNSILMTSCKYIFDLVKFTGEENILGVPLNADKVCELVRINYI